MGNSHGKEQPLTYASSFPSCTWERKLCPGSCASYPHKPRIAPHLYRRVW